MSPSFSSAPLRRSWSLVELLWLHGRELPEYLTVEPAGDVLVFFFLVSVQSLRACDFRMNASIWVMTRLTPSLFTVVGWDLCFPGALF